MTGIRIRVLAVANLMLYHRVISLRTHVTGNIIAIYSSLLEIELRKLNWKLLSQNLAEKLHETLKTDQNMK